MYLKNTTGNVYEKKDYKIWMTNFIEIKFNNIDKISGKKICMDVQNITMLISVKLLWIN